MTNNKVDKQDYKILEMIPTGVAIYNKDGNLEYSNHTANDICKRSVPRNLTSLEISKKDIGKLKKGLVVTTSKNAYYQIVIKPFRKLNNGCFVVFNNSYNNKYLNYLATHDEMTDTYNRNFFETEVERLKGSREFPISVIFADLDNLKGRNDEYGHLEGDRLIVMAGIILKESIRKYDILARIGGDEFTILLPKTSEESVKKVIDRINKRLNSLNKRLKERKVSISIGYAVSMKGSSLKRSIHIADKEMYKVKKQRKQEAVS